MGRGGQSLLIVTLALAASSARAQFDADGDPVGRVVDRAGEPIAGATVQLTIDAADIVGDFADAIRHVLSHSPLPRVISNREGRFVLPLTPDQRRLGVLENARFVLRVDKEGLQPWEEPIARLQDYLGSAVVLSPRPAILRRTIRVENPRPGMRLRLWRTTTTDSGIAPRSELHLVPANGELTVDLPLLAVPSLCATHTDAAAIGAQVQLLFPGMTTVPQRIDPGDEAFVIVPRDDAHRVDLTWQTKRSAPLRVLVTAPGVTPLWFSLGETLEVGGVLAIMAVHAPGCLASRGGGWTMRAAPTPTEPLVLRVPGVSGARAELYALEDTLGWPHARPLARIVAVGDELRLPLRALTRPAVLRVEAPGHEPREIWEPRSLAAGTAIELEERAHGNLELTVRDTDGNPVRDASVFLSNGGYRLGAVRGATPRLDARGTVTIRHLPVQNLAVRIVHEDFLPAREQVAITAGRTASVEVALARSATIHVRTVDENERPVPFLTLLRGAARRPGRFRRVHRVPGVFSSDSQGRVLLRGVVGRDETLPLVALGGPMMDPVICGPDDVATIRSERWPRALVLVEPGFDRMQDNWWKATGGSSSGQRALRFSASALALRWRVGAEGSAIFGTAFGPPIRLLATDLLPARRPPTILDRRARKRRVPLQITPHVDADLHVAPTLPRFSTSLLNDCTMCPLAREGDRWFFEGRDGGAFSAVLAHPDFLLASLEVPAATQPEEPIAVQLHPGVPVTLHARFARRPSQLASLILQATDISTQKPALYLQTALPTPNAAGEVWIRAPHALAPGTYDVQCNAEGFRPFRARIEAKLGEPIVLDVTSR